MRSKPILKKAQAELLDYHGLDMSIMEMRQRSTPVDEMMAEVQASA